MLTLSAQPQTIGGVQPSPPGAALRCKLQHRPLWLVLWSTTHEAFTIEENALMIHAGWASLRICSNLAGLFSLRRNFSKKRNRVQTDTQSRALRLSTEMVARVPPRLCLSVCLHSARMWPRAGHGLSVGHTQRGEQQAW